MKISSSAALPPKDVIQICIALAVVLTYCYLVIAAKASIEGFVGMATYVVKKFLDDLEDSRPAS